MFERPRIMGIVNITRDSFSDGGLYLEPDKAVDHALQLIQDGADILDLGPASSHPDSEDVSSEVEINRLLSVLPILKKEKIQISVDSCLPDTQKFSLGKGVNYLNDIQGFPHPEMYPVLASSQTQLVIMHSIHSGGKASRDFLGVEETMNRVYRFFDTRLNMLEANGIPSGQCILDPGMGFFLGSNPEVSIEMLKKISTLKGQFGLPVLLGISRKSFLRSITGKETSQLGPATLAAELFAAIQGVEYIRTHDVASLHDALKVMDKLFI